MFHGETIQKIWFKKRTFLGKPSKKSHLRQVIQRTKLCFYKFLQNYEFQIVSGCLPGGIPGGLSQFSFTGFTCLRSMSWFLKSEQWLQWLQDIAGDCIWSRQFPESWRCLRVLGWICIYLIFLNPKYPFTLSPSPFFWRWRESMKFCLQPNMSQLLGCVERLKDTGMLWSDWV